MIIIVFFLIVLVYVIFIAQLLYGFRKVTSFYNTNEKPKTTFSIIVPYRNEAKNLPDFLQSIADLNYPKQRLPWPQYPKVRGPPRFAWPSCAFG